MKSPGDWETGPWMDSFLGFLRRYQPFVLTVTAIALIAFLLPGESNETANSAAGTSQVSSGIGQEAVGLVPGETPGETTAVQRTQQTQQAAAAPVLSFEEAKRRGVPLVANCDQSSAGSPSPATAHRRAFPGIRAATPARRIRV
jgi:hypothetical protein